MNSSFKKNLEKRKTINGFGIFSLVEIPKDTTIMEMHGEIISRKEVPASESNRYLQIGRDTFLGPSGDVDDYVSHSCVPNSGLFIVGNRALLKSIVLIPAGTEITFDWSTTSNDSLSSWIMQCNCGSFNCRGGISGYSYLPAAVKTRYESLGIVPDYAVQTINGKGIQ